MYYYCPIEREGKKEEVNSTTSYVSILLVYKKNKLAFDELYGNWEICVMDADGSNIRRLTTHPDNDCGLTWSPNGTNFAFTSERDGNREIYVMDADGSNQTNLTNNPSDDWCLD